MTHGTRHRRALGTLAILAIVASNGAAQAAVVPTCLDQAKGLNDRCEQWLRIFNDRSPDGSAVADSPHGLAVSKRGERLYVATTSLVGAARTRITVAALKPASHGATVWLTHPHTNLTTRAVALALSPNQKIVVVIGEEDYLPTLNAPLETFWLTSAYSASTGRPMWSVVYQGSGLDHPRAVAISPRSDRVFVTGASIYAAGLVQWETVAYSLRTGNQLWRHGYGGRAGGQNIPVAIAVSGRGDRVFVSGLSEHPEHTGQHAWDDALACYDTRSGRQRWLRVAHVGADQRPLAMAVSPRGDAVFVTGVGRFGSATTPVIEPLTQAYSIRTGHVRWTVHGGTAGGVGTPVGIAVSPKSDRIYLTGSRDGGIEFAALNVRSGRTTWVAEYAAPNGYSVTPSTLTLNAAGTRLYVSGLILLGSTAAYPLAVAYTSTGKQAWVARHDLRDPGGAGVAGLAGNVSPVAAVVEATGRHFYVSIDDAPAAPGVDRAVCDLETSTGIADQCVTSNGESDLVLSYAG